MKKPRNLEFGIFVLIAVIGFLIIGLILLGALKMLLKVSWLFAL